MAAHTSRFVTARRLLSRRRPGRLGLLLAGLTLIAAAGPRGGGELARALADPEAARGREITIRGLVLESYRIFGMHNRPPLTAGMYVQRLEEAVPDGERFWLALDQDERLRRFQFEHCQVDTQVEILGTFLGVTPQGEGVVELRTVEPVAAPVTVRQALRTPTAARGRPIDLSGTLERSMRQVDHGLNPPIRQADITVGVRPEGAKAPRCWLVITAVQETEWNVMAHSRDGDRLAAAGRFRGLTADGEPVIHVFTLDNGTREIPELVKREKPPPFERSRRRQVRTRGSRKTRP